MCYRRCYKYRWLLVLQVPQSMLVHSLPNLVYMKGSMSSPFRTLFLNTNYWFALALQHRLYITSSIGA